MMRKIIFGLSVYIVLTLIVSSISLIFSESNGGEKAEVVETKISVKETKQGEIISTKRNETKSPFDFTVNVNTITEEETAVINKKIYLIHRELPHDLAAVMLSELDKRKQKKGGVIMPAVLRLKDQYGNVYTIPAIRGEKGSSIQSIKRTDGDGSAGTIDTYTLTMSGGETFTFYVTNGADGKTHKPGNYILLGENDEISVDMAEVITEEESRPIGANLALSVFQQITNAVKIATGSYTGDGTYGITHPVSLTFEFVPKLVLIADTNHYNDEYLTWFTGCESMLRNKGATFTFRVLPATLTDQTLTFYNMDSAQTQFNETDAVYHYFAIG